MYCQFYGFREKPFSLLPDPEFLFLGSKHEDALNLLQLGILNQTGFCVISGEIGTGKTTLVRELLNRLDERVCTGLITNTHSTYSSLLGWVLAAYGLKCEASDCAVQHRCFTDFIIEQYAHGKHTLLIIDEAQNLSLPALEQLRMLSNINSDKDLVLQIILIGQSELRDKLQKPELEQFAQRIAIDYHLTALDREETDAYIKHRLVKSGGSPHLFDEAACQLVFRSSGGIPRLINRICDLSLVYGYSESRKVIGAELIKAVTARQTLGQPATPRTRDHSDQPAPATSAGTHQATEKPVTAEIAATEETVAAVKTTMDSATMKHAGKRAVQQAAAVLAAAEKTLAEKTAADKLAREEASRQIALAKAAVRAAGAAQQAAGRAADARNAAQENIRVTETAATAAANTGADKGTRTEASDHQPATKPDDDLPPVKHPVPASIQQQSRPRRAGILVALSAISAIVAVSTWMVIRPGDMDTAINALVVTGQSLINPESVTETAAFETTAEDSKPSP